MDTVDKVASQYSTWMENKYVYNSLLLFLILYASKYAPALPSFLQKLFDTGLGKLIMMFILLFVFTKNVKVSILSALIIFVLIIVLKVLVGEKEPFDELPKKEVKLGNCTCQCDTIDASPVKTPDGQLVLQEAKKLEDNNILNPIHVDVVAKEISNVEQNGLPVLAARTEEGAKQMKEIAKAETNGLVSEEVAKQMVAKIVVHEILTSGVQQESMNVISEDPMPHNAEIHIQNIQQSMAPVERVALPVEIASESRMSSISDNMISSESLPVSLPISLPSDILPMNVPNIVAPLQESNVMGQLSEEVLRRKNNLAGKRGKELSQEEVKALCAGVLHEYRTSRGNIKSIKMIEGNDSDYSAYAVF